MIIKREAYLQKLISKKDNGLIKIITGLKGCGKSFLLFNLYDEYLKSIGIEESQIIKLSLDEDINIKYRNPIELGSYIRSLLVNKDKIYYVFIDEIQKVEAIQNPYIENMESKVTFVDTLLGLMKIPNVDLYITGSNSKMLSSDILTEFKDRGDELRVNPLSYKEFCEFKGMNGNSTLWQEYITYGGMPLAVSKQTHDEKSKYLKDLFSKTYITDIIERHKIKNNKDVLEDLLNIVSSGIGSLTNPNKLSDTFKSIENKTVTASRISKYLDYLIDAFLLSKANRYDVKGKKYINTPLKYYFTDIGLRNARLNFRQQEESHIMENVIYNELVLRGFDVDVGVIEYNYKDENKVSKRKQFEIDFVANKGTNRYYVQSALHIDDESKRIQETNSLNRIDDSFKKIIVVKDDIIHWKDEKGILYLSIQDFLLNENAIDW